MIFFQIAVTKKDPMSTISLVRTARAEDGSLQLGTTRFWDAKLADLHKMAKDNAVNDESLVRTVQRNFYVDNFPNESQSSRSD